MESRTFGFGDALEGLKAGEKLTREGWNGVDMYLYLVRGGTFVAARQPVARLMGEGTVCRYRDHIDMKTAQGDLVPWVASQSDLLASDWFVVP